MSAIKKISRSHRNGADGWFRSEMLLSGNHPVRSQYGGFAFFFVELASTPPDGFAQKLANGRIPLLFEEGWTRPQVKYRAAPLRERTGWSLTQNTSECIGFET